MATIEPRLMHLLNDSKAELPPIQPSAGRSTGHALSLPPLEPNTAARGEFTSAKGQISQQSLPLYIADEIPVPIPIRRSSRRDGPHTHAQATATRPSQAPHSLQLLLENPESNVLSHSLRMILDDTTDVGEDVCNKKRHRALAIKEDFVQLPQPLKKQKSAQQVVPPIINGLHEPPPNAAVFPPISSERTFSEAEPMTIAVPKDVSSTQEDPPVPAAPSEAERANAVRVKRKALKPRRKWSEAETTHLLLGVSRHGVGKWTTILEDPDFTFDDRTAGDLKDRFRTCCPTELRNKAGGKSQEEPPRPSTTTETTTPPKAKTGIHLENILIESGETTDRDPDPSPAAQAESDSAAKPKKSRAHRKKMEDLAELGIQGPFKKSHRRVRRPFTEQDDKDILEGLHFYGPAWTKIQRDSKFGLSSRQPTDLRDRVRNKYPEIYAKIEKGQFQINDLARATNLLEPSVNTTIENTLATAMSAVPLDPQLTHAGSRDDINKWASSSNLWDLIDFPGPGSTSFDLGENPPSTLLAGGVNEMDISRLLLDDSQLLDD